MAPTVLITGASQGIGRETALLFARQGYNLVLSARQPERLQTVAQEVSALGQQVLAIPTDVREAAQVQSLIEQGLVRFGKIDALINNAGIYVSGPAEQFSLEDWHQVLDTNLWGYIHTIHFLLPHFLERGQGTIVNLCSIAGLMPSAYLVPYVTSKYAVHGLTKSLHSELAPKGIHVCGIYPNLIKSSLMERAIFRGKDETEAQKRRHQVEQVLQVPVLEKPEDVAKAVWDAVAHKRKEVLVGSAKLSATASKLLPGPMQWLYRQTFKHRS
jgi:NADP-dependent 3-hydroxy acid dehydrogenase YdfG